jgi:hypothetical protein
VGIIIIIIIIIGKDTISYMHGIYTYIPETNHVPNEYNVAAILSLLFIVPVSLAPALALMYLLLLILLSSSSSSSSSSLALHSSAGYGLLVSRGFLITHNEMPR